MQQPRSAEMNGMLWPGKCTSGTATPQLGKYTRISPIWSLETSAMFFHTDTICFFPWNNAVENLLSLISIICQIHENPVQWALWSSVGFLQTLSWCLDGFKRCAHFSENVKFLGNVTKLHLSLLSYKGIVDTPRHLGQYCSVTCVFCGSYKKKKW